MLHTPLLDAALAVEPNGPRYHYTSVEAIDRILTTDELWASAVRFSNDTTELVTAVRLARSMLSQKEYIFRTPVSKVVVRDCIYALEKVELYHVCVFSLSEDGDLLSQWRGYCPPNGGYALSLPGVQLRRHLGDYGCVLAKCIYEESMHYELIKETVDLLVDGLRRSAIPSEEQELDRFAGAYSRDVLRMVARVAPLLKHKRFAEEREWRIIWDPAGVDDRLNFRAARNMIVPFLKIPLASRIEGPLPIGVTIGPMSHQEIAANAMDARLKRREGPCMGVHRSEIPFRSL